MWFKKFVIYQYTMYATALYAMAVRLSIRYQESETNLNAHSKKTVANHSLRPLQDEKHKSTVVAQYRW